MDGILLFSPWKTKITALNFALWLSVLPKHNSLDLVLFVEYSAHYRTATAVNLFGCYTFIVQDPFHTGMNLVMDAHLMMVIKYPLKERRDFLHDTLHPLQ